MLRSVGYFFPFEEDLLEEPDDLDGALLLPPLLRLLLPLLRLGGRLTDLPEELLFGGAGRLVLVFGGGGVLRRVVGGLVLEGGEAGWVLGLVTRGGMEERLRLVVEPEELPEGRVTPL